MSGAARYSLLTVAPIGGGGRTGERSWREAC